MRHIHAHNFCEGLVFQKLLQKTTLTTAKVEYTLSAAAAKGSNDRSHALFVQDRNQDIEMCQQITQSNCGVEGDREIWALSPFREFFIERMASCADFIAQRLE